MDNTNIDAEIREQIFTMYRNIKYLREKNNLSTKQLAQIIEISEKRLIASEECKAVGYFYDKHIRNTCRYFKISADILLNEQLY